MKLKIRDKFIIHVTLILFLLTSLFTYSILELQKRNKKKVLEQKINRDLRALSTINQIPLWNVEYKTMKKNLNSFLEDPDIVRISVFDHSGAEVIDLEKEYNIKTVIKKKAAVNYQNQKIGLIEVYFTTRYLEESIDKMRNHLLLWALAIYIVMVTIIVIISNMVTEPLNRLAHNIHELDFNNPEKLTTGIEKTDLQEVDMLLSSYQEMVGELAAAFEELDAKTERLNQSYQEVEKVNKNLQEIISLSSSLSSSVFAEEKEEFLHDLLEKANSLISEADYGSIYLVEEGKINYIDAIGHNLEQLQELDLNKENFEISNEEVVIIDNISEEENLSLDSETENKFYNATKKMKSSLIFKLCVNDKWKGGISLDIAEGSEAEFEAEAIESITAFGNLASAFLTMKNHRDIHEKFQQELIMSFIKLLELYDKYTKGHSQGVANLCFEIAEGMGLDEETVNLAYWSGMLHDIGKILVDKDILNKPSRLTDDEYEEIKYHSNYGYQVLKESSSSELRTIANYIRYHHERWDGGGYPEGLAGEEIPLISRIICVADTWNTMRTDRPYREKLSRVKAIEELKDNKGTQFAPEVVDVFLDLLNCDKNQNKCII
ncbi:HD-GYP domain-containing protein [Halanaerobacter jeridensis]|uniref:HD-GYP domain-containing protein (C-di-GMP phosphodiesterase class II) n=1 Tax=Halanaerobacter jeridensis TaxID=706427 RepID=A0A939BSS1_9FIRM|nr:HD-GYP domain-containing protein [Halanaerobacter jeridensis]MBM7557436.1 HD-GYP domain-containing protein (c-di-GMP phosphodiesterase class II) [Halanaerobacter jeridensis]